MTGRPPQWDLLNCLVYVNNQRVEDGSQGGNDTALTVLAGLTVQWGRDSTVDQPGPSTCGFELMDLDGRNGFLELLRVGAFVDVDAVATGTNPVRVFSGRITDVTAVWDAAIGGVRLSVTAVDTLGELGSMLVATDVMPQQTLAARVSKVMTAAGYTGPLVIDSPAAAIQVTAQDIDHQSALQVLQDLTSGLDLVLWGASVNPTGNYLEIEDPATRVSLMQLDRAPGGLVSIIGVPASSDFTTIDACDVLLDPVEWVQDVSDVATSVTVGWLSQQEYPPLDASVTHVSELNYNGSTTGIRSVMVSSPLVSLFDAEALATRLLFRLAYIGWRINGLTLDLRDTAELDAAQRARARVLLDASQRHGRGIQLVGLPDWSPLQGNQSAYLEGGTYTYDGQGWTLELNVSNAAGLGDSVEYNELDPTWSYNDVDPSITYNKLIGVGP